MPPPPQPFHRLVLTTLVCLCLGAVLAGGAVTSAQDDRATVRLDGRSVIRVGPTAELSAADRARQIERRLATLLATPDALGPAQVEPAGATGADRVVTVAGVPVVSVTESDAADNLSSVDVVAAQWAAAVDQALQRAAATRLAPGGRFVVEVRGAIEAALARLVESTLRVIPRVLAALLVLAVVWALASAVRRVLRLVFRRVVDDLTVENLLKQLAYYAVWVVGLIVAVDALGLDPATVATGLGLTGLALGFALQDIISNFVSGLLLLLLRPFELGDQIVVGETEGSVERIQLRASQIRTYDGRLVLVPNAELFTARVTNNTASPVRRGSVEVYVSYEADLERAQAVIGTATRSAPGVLAGPPTSVRVRGLEPEEVRLEARFWTDSRRSDFVATASAVRQAIVVALRASEIPLPEPTVYVTVPQPPTDLATTPRERSQGENLATDRY